MTTIEIWEPRYHDDVALIARHKVEKAIRQGEQKIRIKFTKAKSLKGKIFEVDVSTIISSKLSDNGKIKCYEVAMDKLYEISG